MQKKDDSFKIEALLKELTLDEKIAMVHASELFRNGEVKRLGIPKISFSDGPVGIRNDFYPDRWVPIGSSKDEVGAAPCNAALASTWNRKLASKTGRTLGEEARGRGKDMLLAPGINIKRNPLCGRNFEYMSEDPYLIAQIAVPLVKGIQECDVSACVKHFACNNQEYERYMVNVEVDERAFREIYLPGFEAVVKEGKTWGLMGAYNLFRGMHASENAELFTEILRKEFAYDGLIVSDWKANHDTVDAYYSGLDVEMGITDNFDDYYMAKPLKKLIKSGKADPAVLDEKIRNILRLMLRIKLIDIEVKKMAGGKTIAKAVPVSGRKKGEFATPAHTMNYLETAREAVVLLKNEDKRLPILPEKAKRILVVGDNADRKHSPGGGSAEVKALHEVTPLNGICSVYGGNTEVRYAKGYYVPKKRAELVNWQADTGVTINDLHEYDIRDVRTYSAEEQKKIKDLRAEAVKLAKEYDEVIFVGGLDHDYDVEDQDRLDMKLPYFQDELIDALLKANKNTVIVMMSGSPVDMSHFAKKAKAIVWMAYNGMEGGRALGEVLAGEVNPSGKLSETIPYKHNDCSAFAIGEYPGRKLTDKESKTINANLTEEYKDGVFVGYRYYEKFKVPVQFAFGHGLSYTSFKYSGMTLKKGKGASFDVSLKVKNTGKFYGAEVVQLYTGEEKVSKENPIKELKGFEKVFLKPGEEKTVRFKLKEKDFSHYCTEEKKFVCMKGGMKIYAAAASDDVRLTKTVKI